MPVRNEAGMWVEFEQVEMSKKNLMAALSYTAQYLHGRGKNITLIAVGGAVNTILLETRRREELCSFKRGLAQQCYG